MDIYDNQRGGRKKALLDGLLHLICWTKPDRYRDSGLPKDGCPNDMNLLFSAWFGRPGCLASSYLQPVLSQETWEGSSPQLHWPTRDGGAD